MILPGVNLRLTLEEAHACRRHAKLAAQLGLDLAQVTGDTWWLDFADRMARLALCFGDDSIGTRETLIGPPTWSLDP